MKTKKIKKQIKNLKSKIYFLKLDVDQLQLENEETNKIKRRRKKTEQHIMTVVFASSIVLVAITYIYSIFFK